MKKLTFSLILFYGLFSSFVYAQGEFVVEVNRINGSYIKTGPAIAPIQWVIPQDRTMNENNGTFIFPSSQPTQSIFSIDVSNGSTISNPVFTNLNEFQFDNSASTLYCFYQSGGQKTFASVDPATAIPTMIGTPMTAGLFQGFSTYDQNNHRYIFVDPPAFITTINAATGAVLTSPPIVFSSNATLVHMCYNNANDTLYGYFRDNNSSLFYLAWIDQLTGVATSLGQGTNVGSGMGCSAIDEANRQYIFLHNDPSGYFVVSVDITSGSIISNVQITTPDPLDNFYSLDYDNSQGKLYAIHWDNFIDETNSVAENSLSPVAIYPNPSNGVFNFTVKENDLLDGSIDIYDVFGKTVFSWRVQHPSTAIDLSGNAAGLYFYKMSDASGPVSTGKIILR